jgi:hypothetical protein
MGVAAMTHAKNVIPTKRLNGATDQNFIAVFLSDCGCIDYMTSKTDDRLPPLTIGREPIGLGDIAISRLLGFVVPRKGGNHEPYL